MSIDNPQVILSAGNITHYHHAAYALNKRDYLRRYLYSFGYTDSNEWWIKLLPKYRRREFLGRHIQKLPRNLVKYSPISEIISRSLIELGLITRDKGYSLFNELFDISMLPWVYGCNIFHFVSPIGLYCARRAKSNGSILICDLRSPHPEIEHSIVRQEYFNLGLQSQPPNVQYVRRSKKEYSISDYFIVPSKFVADTLISCGYDNRNIFIVPYGVDLSTFRNISLGQESRKDGIHKSFNILFVGQIGPRKGVQYLLRAFAKFDIPEARLIFIGGVEPGFQNFLNNFIMDDNRILLLGQLPYIDVYEYYRNASVFVLPSLSEGSARVIYEAMAAGVPVLTTINAGSIIIHHKDGIIVRPREENDILSNLVMLYEYPNIGREISANAVKTVKEYSWEKYGDRLLDVYKEIIERRD